MKSCIYRGQVKHRRLLPHEHSFHYGLFFMYLDLDELPSLFNRFWLWSASHPAPAWFRRKDHSGDAQTGLKKHINQLATVKTGRLHDGPVRLLTHLRYWGYCFNPVSFYYCFDNQENLQSIICEVNNTPWGEQHLYVLDAIDQQKQSLMTFNDSKAFHVSPFMPLEMDYVWRFNIPDEKLTVYMSNFADSASVQNSPAKNGRYQRIFDASLDLQRQPINHRQLATVLVTYPLMTVKVVAAIYYQALKLWMKKIPFFAHPSKNKIVEEKPL